MDSPFSTGEAKILYGTPEFTITEPGAWVVCATTGERIRARDFNELFPTHGPSIRRPGDFLNRYIAHRRAREAGVLACVEAGVGGVRAVVDRLYPGLDRKLLPAAAHSVLAHLITLREEGRVEGDRADGLACRYFPIARWAVG